MECEERFQPFLRFWLLFDCVIERAPCKLDLFQPFLRFWLLFDCVIERAPCKLDLFQPFLRFWSLCSWFLRVFKFFFGFLSFRRSAWNNALHSFHSALGRDETPFFGAPKKEKKERKKAGKNAVLRRSEELGACRVVNTAGRPS